MTNVPNISANVGEAPRLHTSPYKKRKKMKEKLDQYLKYNKKLKKKVSVKEVLDKVNSNVIRRKDLD